MKRLLAVLVLAGVSVNAQTVTQVFGSGAYSFSMEFVTIGNPNNPAATTSSPNPVGSVPYVYNLGKHEVSRDMVLKASTAGGLGLTLHDMTSYGGNGLDRPATGVTWNEAARFVNWLNTSKGYQAAYLFDGSGNFQVWSSVRAAGNNLYRHKDAYYFLPSVDEWFKGAYYNPNAGYNWYPTSSDTLPTAVSGGTNLNTAVFNQNEFSGPADIKNAGGLSFYGTMGQGGNAAEILETANDGMNDLASEDRMKRGGSWYFNNFFASNVTGEFFTAPNADWADQGFRIASIPEPSGLHLLSVGSLILLRRKRSLK